MKALKLLIVILVTTLTVQAQTTALTVTLKKGLTMLDSAKTSEQYLQAAGYFQNIADAEKKQWLPYYYTAYSNLMAAINSKGANDLKDNLYDKAMLYTNKADIIVPQNSEVYVLKGYITFMKMSVEPQARAMQMIPEADTYLIKATSLDAENPRVYMVRGQSAYFTPEMFGGGKDVAKPLLATGVEKYNKQAAKDAAPSWGKARCATLLKQCN